MRSGDWTEEICQERTKSWSLTECFLSSSLSQGLPGESGEKGSQGDPGPPVSQGKFVLPCTKRLFS